jgi:hypothetical protein
MISIPYSTTPHGISSHPTQHSPIGPSRVVPSVAVYHDIPTNVTVANINITAVERQANDDSQCEDPACILETSTAMQTDPMDPNMAPQRLHTQDLSSSASISSNAKSTHSPTSPVAMYPDTDDETDNSKLDGSPLTFATHDSDDDDKYDYEYHADLCMQLDEAEGSPLTFAKPDLDEDEELGLLLQRRGSWPIIPGPILANAEDDTDEAGVDGKSGVNILKRRSKSLTFDDPAPIPPKDNWMGQAQHQNDAEECAVYGELDIEYILDGQANSHRSPDQSRYTQRQPRPPEVGYLLSLRRKLTGSARTPSIIATNEEDTFTKNLEKWDPDYDTLKEYWTIRRQEEVDRINPRTTLASNVGSVSEKASVSESRMSREKNKSKEKEKQVVNKGMAPGTHEYWRCGFVGMFKAERMTYMGEPPFSG